MMYTLEKKIEIINRLVPDKNMQDIIFMFDNNSSLFMQNEKENIRYFYNILVFSAALVYRSFVDWNNNLSGVEKDASIEMFNNASIRQYNLLRSLYDTNKFELNFIEDLFSNIQIDLYIHPDDNFLKMIGIDNLIDRNKSLSKYIFGLKQSRLTSRGGVLFGFEDLEDVLKTFRYLSSIKVEYTDSKFGNKYQETIAQYNSKNINLEELLLVKPRKIMLMEDFTLLDSRQFCKDSQKEQKITINYVSFNLRETLKVLLTDVKHEIAENKKCINYFDKSAIEEFLIKYNIIDFTNKTNEEHFFKDYISFNNKYIKYFSLIISDVISIETKQYIISKYNVKYLDVFNKLKVDAYRNIRNANNYKWDELIVFLLLEEGIFNFLTDILKNTKEKYSDFIKHYHLRFPDETKKIINKFELVENPANVLGNSKMNTAAYAQALIFLTSQLFSIDTIDYESSSALETIVDKIYDLEQIKNLTNDKLRIANVTIKLLNTLKFLYVFYKGVFAYIEEKSVNDLALKQSWFPSYEQYRKKNREYLDLFSSAVSKTKEECESLVELNKMSISSQYYGKAIVEICSLFDKLLKLNEISMTRTGYMSQVLYDTLGKREVFDNERFVDYKTKILELYSELKISTNKKSIIDSIFIELEDLFLYLGGYTANKVQNFEDAIYPVIGTYSNGVISEDGYRYSYFKFIKDIHNNYTRIKFVIDDDFDFAETYFCLPHINRTTKLIKSKQEELIWVSPIVIPYKYYSKEFIYDEDDASVRFSALILDEDFESVAELLYQTDENIYGSLFGSLENAKKVLVKLFNNQKSVFYKDNFYIVKEDNNIVAVASLYKEMPKWDSEQVVKAFFDCKLDVPDTAKNSYMYFEDTFEDTKANMYEVCDICVKEGYRKKGYGKFLLNNLNKISKDNGRDLMITVYKDNNKAIGLYTQLGFIPYSNDYDNRGIGTSPNSEYLKMIKYNINKF